MAQGTGRLTKLEADRVKGEFVQWLALDTTAKRNLSLPLNQREFAEHVGVTDRTLRRWRDDPKFEKRVAQAKVRLANGAPGATISALPRPNNDPESLEPARNGVHPEIAGLNLDDPGLADYQTLRKALRDKAVSGDSEKALELWLKHFGKPYLEQDARALESTFTDLEDAELVDRTLDLIGLPAVTAWLERQ